MEQLYTDAVGFAIFATVTGSLFEHGGTGEAESDTPARCAKILAKSRLRQLREEK